MSIRKETAIDELKSIACENVLGFKDEYKKSSFYRHLTEAIKILEA
jgi:hypothetical protein